MLISVPSHPWGFALHLTTYGSRLFRSESFRIDISRRVAERAAFGITVAPEGWRAQGYPAVWSGTVGVGCLLIEGPAVIGVRYASAVGRDRSGDHELAVGASVAAATGVRIGGEVRQEPGQTLEAVYAFSYRPVEWAEVIIGWKDDPRMVGGGVGLVYSGVEVMLGANWHAVLGWTSAIGGGVRW